MDREDPDWKRMQSAELKDFFGFKIKVGDRLLKPELYGSTPLLTSCVVTSIKDKKIYLDNSKVPIQFPGRCVNISHLITMNDVP